MLLEVASYSNADTARAPQINPTSTLTVRATVVHQPLVVPGNQSLRLNARTEGDLLQKSERSLVLADLIVSQRRVSNTNMMRKRIYRHPDRSAESTDRAWNKIGIVNVTARHDTKVYPN
jgi:hypothetical protein